MAKLGELLTTPVDEIEVPIIPTGTWLAQVVAGQLTDEKLDKNDNPYCMSKLTFRITGPSDVGDVDDDELDSFTAADGYDESVLYYSRFMSRKSDFKSEANKLKAAGAAVTGKNLGEILSNGVAGLVFNVEVKHETWEGEVRPRCDKIFAAD